MLYLIIQGDLSENIKKIYPKDSVESPAEYAFDLVCTSCREANESPIVINGFEKHEMPGSKGEASFLLKCKFCGKDCSVNLNYFEDALYNEPNINKDKRKKSGLKSVSDASAAILQLDCRGCDLKQFYLDSIIFNVELSSGKVLECQFDKGENEWYDYDDDAGEEVTITDFCSEFVKGK